MKKNQAFAIFTVVVVSLVFSGAVLAGGSPSGLNPSIHSTEWEGKWYRIDGSKESDATTIMRVLENGFCDYRSKKNVMCPYTVESEDTFVVHHPDGARFRFKFKDNQLKGEDLNSIRWRIDLKKKI